MNRPTKIGRSLSTSNSPTIEPLESRLLLASDMLVSVFDDTGGLSVLRFDDTFAPTAGGVATSASVGMVQGLAVDSDGSFYISSLISGQVLHYDSAGNFLGALGSGDAVPAPIQAPATLAFGPNGNLYVADLQSASIFQFDTSSPTQQYLQSETLFLGYAPGGFDFEDDGDLVVGDLFFQGLNHYDSGGNITVWIEQFSGINPAAVLVQPDGDVLIGDITFGDDPLAHHQVVKYDVSEDTFSQFINLTTPVGTGSSAGYPPQPSALAYDQNGDLLVGLSPDHNLNGAIQRYNPLSGAFIETLVSNIGTPTGIAFTPAATEPATIVGRQLFYNQSKFDGNSAAINASDDAAIATDKVAFDGLGVAPISALSSYTRGINGIMVDIENAANSLSLSDFTFKMGSNNMPSLWGDAPEPSGFSVRAGAGANGSDRVVITWANGAISNQWLQVIVEGDDSLGGNNANTGLVASDVFFFGSRVGDTFVNSPATVATTNAADEIAVRNSFSPNKPITNAFDFNKDGLVSVGDEIAARNNIGALTRVIDWAMASAPEAEPAVSTADGHSAVASALALPSDKTPAASAPAVQMQADLAVQVRLRERFFAQLSAAANQPKSSAGETATAFDALLDELADDLPF